MNNILEYLKQIKDELDECPHSVVVKSVEYIRNDENVCYIRFVDTCGDCGTEL